MPNPARKARSARNALAVGHGSYRHFLLGVARRTGNHAGRMRAAQGPSSASSNRRQGTVCTHLGRRSRVGGYVGAEVRPVQRDPGMLRDVIGEERGRRTDDELPPQGEVGLLERMLHHQAGVDPDRVGQVFDLAAVGIVNGAWRNGPVEDWHAGEGPLTDGAMLRINAHTTWRVREIVRRWRSEVGMAAGSPAAALDDVDVDETNLLSARIWRWLVRPMRQLPIGVTLAELAGDGLQEYRDHADTALGSFAATAERRGARCALWGAAAHGGLACRHWWGTPGWPQLVETFVAVLDDPDHAHWTMGIERRDGLIPEPAQVIDRTELRRALLRCPWTLETEAADWVVRAGIGFLQPPLPPLPVPTS